MKETPLDVDSSPAIVKNIKPESSPAKVESNINDSKGLGNHAIVERPDFSESLNKENKGFFARLGEGAKQIASWTYEKTLGKVVGNAKILYHEYWMTRHNAKAEGLKQRIAEVNEKIALAEKSHAEISKSLEDLRAMNTPNMKSVEEKLRAIENEKRKHEGIRDNFQVKLDKRNEKMQKRIEKRDAVVAGFIGKSNERLVVAEEKLEEAKSNKQKFEARASMAEIMHNRKLDECKKQKEIMQRIEKALRASGMTEYAITSDAGLGDLRVSIEKGEKEIAEAKAEIDKERNEMEAKLQENESKTNKHKNKVAQFQKMKEGKLEQVVSEADEVKVDAPNGKPQGGDIESYIESGTEKQKVADYIEKFNSFLQEEFGDNNQPEVIDMDKFKEMTQGIEELEVDAEIDFNQFKEIAEKYLHIKGVKSDRLNDLLEDFYEMKVKVIEENKE